MVQKSFLKIRQHPWFTIWSPNSKKVLHPKLFLGSDKILRVWIYIEDVIQANIKACKPKNLVFIMLNWKC